jgi:hypothetical protein
MQNEKNMKSEILVSRILLLLVSLLFFPIIIILSKNLVWWQFGTIIFCWAVSFYSTAKYFYLLKDRK